MKIKSLCDDATLVLCIFVNNFDCIDDVLLDIKLAEV